MLLLMMMIGTALLSSALTLAVAAAWYRATGRRQLEARLVELQQEFELRVKNGVLAAGQELLPALREHVRLGFEDVLKGSRAAGIAEGTAKIVAGSTDLLVDRLGNLFGMRKK